MQDYIYIMHTYMQILICICICIYLDTHRKGKTICMWSLKCMTSVSLNSPIEHNEESCHIFKAHLFSVQLP